MSALNDLIDRIQDESLRCRIQEEVNKISKQKKFGLVFEEHLPECTVLYDEPIRKGCNVTPRSNKAITDIFLVKNINNGTATCELINDSKEIKTFSTSDLVAVAQFGEPIYPYLKPLDSICNAPDSDLWHTLIEADNYHALQLLEYLYAGKVDCIYIDPPYNTGARDWKYNNDYVDNNDCYRHSKWLSMMRKRLVLAGKLLNKSDSTLIVTIDDKEVNRLGCLLEDIFPEANIQMITSVISPGGRGKKKGTDFTNTEEYIFYLRFGNAKVFPEIRREERIPLNWRGLIRGTLANGRGKHGVGACGPNQFYPIYVNNTTHQIQEIGEPIAENVNRFSVKKIDGCTAVFPVRPDGTEMNWGCVPEEAKSKLANGYLRVSGYYPNKPQQFGIQYLTSGSINDISSGKVIIEGRRDDGSVYGYYPSGKPMLPSTVWSITSHNATKHGTELIKGIFHDSRFDYPKSLYAVHDSISHVMKGKKDALVIDFFSGSGTTLHAINLLNAEDNGRRRCIMVTNNEISEEEAKLLQEQGFRPGDETWERLGIARYVTWPRTVCTITGKDISGSPLSGEYLSNKEDGILMCDGFAANANFFKLSFLNKTSVALGRQFYELLPLLWMKSGAINECPNVESVSDVPDMLILPKNHFAIITNEKLFIQFKNELVKYPEIDTVYIVTDSADGYQEMSSELNVIHTYQLYSDYLDNFKINNNR